MGAVNLPEDIGSWMRDHERQIRQIRDRVGNVSSWIGEGGLEIGDSGSLRMTDADGGPRAYIGLRTDLPLPDGSPQPVVEIYDDAGVRRFAIYDPLPSVDGYVPVVWIFDHLGHIAFTTDINGGVAEPWIPIPMARLFNDTQFLDTMGVFPSLPVSACSGGIAWEGRIGKVSHPKIQIDGVWGRYTGSSGSPTYTLEVNGASVGSWAQTSLTPIPKGPYSIASLIGQSNIPVTLRVSATGTGTDRIAIGVLACYQRQT